MTKTELIMQAIRQSLKDIGCININVYLDKKTNAIKYEYDFIKHLPANIEKQCRRDINQSIEKNIEEIYSILNGESFEKRVNEAFDLENDRLVKEVEFFLSLVGCENIKVKYLEELDVLDCQYTFKDKLTKKDEKIKKLAIDATIREMAIESAKKIEKEIPDIYMDILNKKKNKYDNIIDDILSK